MAGSLSAAPTPLVSAAALPNCCVKVVFKKSIFDGVIVESQRNGETVWASLGMRLQTPFMDERAPLVVNTPETRRYGLRYIDGDERVGDYSDIVSVSTVV